MALVSVDSVINASSSKRLHSGVMTEVELQADARRNAGPGFKRRAA